MAVVELASTSLFSDANLLSYWKLENTSDSKGSNTLTNNNTIAFNAAKFNNGADQGASNSNKYLSVATNLGIAGNGIFTFSFWIKLKSEITSGTWTIASHRSTTGADRYFDVNYEYNGGTQRLYTDAGGNNTNRYAVALGTSIFHHIAAVRNSTNSLLYVDGSLQTTNGLGVGTEGTNRFGIGATGIGISPSSAIFDDFAVFSRELTATEISNLYNGFPVSGGAFLMNFI